jgi:hypothetical protein
MTASPVSGKPDSDWEPEFQAERLRKDGRHAASEVACDGADRHQLSMSMRTAGGAGIAGAVLIAVDVHFHVYGRGLGAGIGLLMLPLIAFLFARWVDGPVLYYRSWGRLHQLALTSVTAVSTGNRGAGRRTVLLSAPGLVKPFRLGFQSRGFAVSPAARDHLRCWMSAPHVQWTPEAEALLAGDRTLLRSARRSRWRRPVWLLVFVLSLVVGGVGVWLVHERSRAFAIPGTAGYETFSGPHGMPLPVGRPWGTPCQPIRFAVAPQVPNWAYDEIGGAVFEARSHGIDVTLESRSFAWSPRSLYYAHRQSPATTIQVDVFADDGTPPQLENGHPEHIEFGWNARLDPDGSHEDLTSVQGTLWMRTIGHDVPLLALAMRQLIAMTQGIFSTSHADSAITDGTSFAHFTPADISAMKRMSGCDRAPAP